MKTLIERLKNRMSFSSKCIACECNFSIITAVCAEFADELRKMEQDYVDSVIYEVDSPADIADRIHKEKK